MLGKLDPPLFSTPGINSPESALTLNILQFLGMVVLKIESPAILNSPSNFIYFLTLMTLISFTLQSEEDWRYVGLVIDRLLFWIFAVVAVAGTVAIFIPAPVFWERPDHHEPLVYEDPILLEALTYNQFYNITS